MQVHGVLSTPLVQILDQPLRIGRKNNKHYYIATHEFPAFSLGNYVTEGTSTVLKDYWLQLQVHGKPSLVYIELISSLIMGDAAWQLSSLIKNCHNPQVKI